MVLSYLAKGGLVSVAWVDELPKTKTKNNITKSMSL